MIEKIEISNFKSIDTLELDLGRFNVFIGDNGSGKSNILEAVALAGAASADKLDHEFLSSRGIRITSFKLMQHYSHDEYPILINIENNKQTKSFFHIINDTKNTLNLKNIVKDTINEQLEDETIRLFNSIKDNINDSSFLKLSDDERKSISTLLKNATEEQLKKYELHIKNEIFQRVRENLNPIVSNDNLSNYILYSPEQNALRTFSSESQIKPLGRNGEGLFNLLKDVVESDDKTQFNKLKEYLQIIDWFKDIEIAYDTFGQRAIKVRDRFIEDEGKYLDQYSVNEGFLFILFYLLLFDSKKTPNLFAIDNLEASFHPDLCKELTKILTEITIKNQKQVLITTHSPFVLDGLDLNNPDVRLFVVYRNRIGATKVKPVEPLKTNMKLSEAWLKGFLGGKPKTFIS